MSQIFINAIQRKSGKYLQTPMISDDFYQTAAITVFSGGHIDYGFCHFGV
ncbi:MAG: hypothetical protein V7700_19040 [Halioglobus sp.]